MATNFEYPTCPVVNSREVGAEFLDFVMVTLQSLGMYLQPFTSKKYQYNKGESFQGWEIKIDRPFTKTGRLSIEIAEKAHGGNINWVPSGIYRSDNTWLYIQGSYDYFFIFLKKHLVALHKSKKYEEAEWPHLAPTVRKFYLPVADACQWGQVVIPGTDDHPPILLT